MKVQVKARGASSVKLKFLPGVPGPGTEWRVNEATARFEYRPTGSNADWVEAPGSDFETIVGSLTAEQITVTQTGTGAVSRSVKLKFDDVFNVKDYGAKGDGITNDSTAIQDTLNRVAAIGRGRVHIPRGTYIVTSSLIIPGNCRITGDGIEATRIKWSEANNCFDRPASGSTRWPFIAIEDLTIEGGRGSNTASSQRIPVNILNADYVRIERVRIEDCRYFGFVMRTCTFVSVTNCHVWQVSRDGISCATCTHVNISNNTIDHCDDDAITAHSFDSEGAKVWRSVVISGNRISDSQGICALGASRVSITGNQLERCRLRGIFIALNSPEGYSNAHSISITGNTITDMVNRSTIDGLSNGGDYIVIGGERQAGALLSIPGEPQADGTFTNLYDNLQNNGATAALIGAARVTISGNSLGRTLPVGVAYSSYGRGLMFTRNGYVDPTMTTAILAGGSGILLSKAAREMIVASNVIQGVASGIFMTGGTNHSYDNLIISGNIISDVTTGGVVCAGSLVKGRSLLISDNIFDCDPFHTNSNRNADGSWKVLGGVRAIYNQNGTGFMVQGNTFKNCCVIADNLTNSGDKKTFFKGNVAECQPATQGFSTSNKGIGSTPRTGSKVSIRVVDCDPTSATYGEVLNNCEEESSAMPTTGTYVSTHFVYASSVGVVNDKILLGWRRLTTGSNHVLGVDWSALYVNTTNV